MAKTPNPEQSGSFVILPQNNHNNCTNCGDHNVTLNEIHHLTEWKKTVNEDISKLKSFKDITEVKLENLNQRDDEIHETIGLLELKKDILGQVPSKIEDLKKSLETRASHERLDNLEKLMDLRIENKFESKLTEIKSDSKWLLRSVLSGFLLLSFGWMTFAGKTLLEKDQNEALFNTIKKITNENDTKVNKLEDELKDLRKEILQLKKGN